MASKKQTVPQAPGTPFNTPQGGVPGAPNYSGQRAPDFSAGARSKAQDATRQAGRNFTGESRRQDAPEAPTPAAPEPQGNYGQHRAGIDPASIPAGGIVNRPVPGSSRGNGADAGPTPERRPFRLKG